MLYIVFMVFVLYNVSVVSGIVQMGSGKHELSVLVRLYKKSVARSLSEKQRAWSLDKR